MVTPLPTPDDYQTETLTDSFGQVWYITHCAHCPYASPATAAVALAYADLHDHFLTYHKGVTP